MSKRCIVSVGIGGWFPDGVERLELSLRKVGWKGGFMSWCNTWPPGSPTREVHMHKPWALKAAVDAGYTTVMWLDASCWAVKDPAPIFEHAEEHGYYVVYNGFKVGQWSSDRSLDIFGVTRDEAFTIEDIAAGFVCLDVTNPIAKTFLDEWARHTTHENGDAFVGADDNHDRSVSSDPRVSGHRHDQTVASLILHKLGVTDGVRFGDSLIDTGKTPKPSALITYHGM